MKAPIQTWICWIPRAIAIAFALFLSIFALDVFSEHHGVLETTIALVIHLTPVWLVLAALAVAWRSEAAGGLFFISLGLFYIVMMVHRPVSWWLVVAGPAILIGLLFLISSWFRRHGPSFGGVC